VVIFLFFLFIFDRGLFFVIQKLEFGFHKKQIFRRNFIKFPPGTYSTLIMGSSRAAQGIHPLYIYRTLGQKAYKAMRNATGPKFNYYFYREYKRLVEAPEVVIYGVDYFIFTLRSPRHFMRFFNQDDYRGDHYSTGISLLISNKPQIDSFLAHVLNHYNKILFKNAPSKRKKKFRIIDRFIGFPKRGLLSLKRPASFKMKPYKPFPGREGEYFLKLIEELNQDGVKLILVILPDFIGTYETNFQKDLFVQGIRDLTKPFDNVFLYDYNSPEKFPLSKQGYFNDGGYGSGNSHLSLEGAKFFNQLLIKDLARHYD
jgi:hypothetical protein